jgi:hypothetical protein
MQAMPDVALQPAAKARPTGGFEQALAQNV